MNKLNKYYLLPSQLFVSEEDYEITTVLGSCVSVCLWDNINKIGGINHFMLPYWNGQGLASPKYGNIAIEKLIQAMIAKGSNPKYLQAKIFGGGDVLASESKIFNIGKRNIELAEKILSENNIPIKAKSLGGSNGRRILFCTDTGMVKQKYIETRCFAK
jgi:chemotaxis protein CheD